MARALVNSVNDRSCGWRGWDGRHQHQSASSSLTRRFLIKRVGHKDLSRHSVFEKGVTKAKGRSERHETCRNPEEKDACGEARIHALKPRAHRQQGSHAAAAPLLEPARAQTEPPHQPAGDLPDHNSSAQHPHSPFIFLDLLYCFLRLIKP